LSNINLIDTLSNISLVGQLSNITLIDTLSDITLIDTLSDITLNDTLSDITLNDTLSNLTLSDTLSNITLSDTLSDINLIVPAIGPVSVDWGTPPTLNCTVSIECPDNCGGASMAMTGMDQDIDGIPLANLEVDYEFAGIPSRIIVEPPYIPPIEIDSSSMPTRIKIDAPQLPDTINVKGMKSMPSEIKVVMPTEMPSIEVKADDLPQSIPIDWGDVPTQINISAPDLPTVISVEHDIPTTISIEGMIETISVEGFPDHIPLRLENPEDLVFRVEPAEVKVVIDTDKLITQDEAGQHCFALVPCKSGV